MSSHFAAPQAQIAAASIPHQRAAEVAVCTLEVREWRRLGRRCLFVESAEGRTVGILNVNTGLVTLTDENERPQFEAAIAGWFAGAIDGSVADADPEPAPSTAGVDDAASDLHEAPALDSDLECAAATEPIADEASESVALIDVETSDPVAATASSEYGAADAKHESIASAEPTSADAEASATEGAESIGAAEPSAPAAAEPAQTGFRLAARARARLEGPGASVRARFARILEEHAEETRRSRAAMPEQRTEQDQTEPRRPEAVTRGVTVVDDERPEVGRGRHRGRGENIVQPRREELPNPRSPRGETRPTGGRHRAG